MAVVSTAVKFYVIIVVRNEILGHLLTFQPKTMVFFRAKIDSTNTCHIHSHARSGGLPMVGPAFWVFKAAIKHPSSSKSPPLLKGDVTICGLLLD